ncbi:hypothetical protein [Streptomyces sp. NPDC058495]|uniref:hypothetical protein n=1 Tax=unclassified Streptomyces TaxID=2593676 RepID=UPI00366A34BB
MTPHAHAPAQHPAAPPRLPLVRVVALVVVALAACVAGLGAGIGWSLLGAGPLDSVAAGALAFSGAATLGLGAAAYLTPPPAPPVPCVPPPAPAAGPAASFPCCTP